jgi:hypothetical protein
LIKVSGIFDESKILKGSLDERLAKVCEFSGDNKKCWRLLYRASEHGFAAQSFHSRCDNQANILTVIKTTKGFIFGGYTQTPWKNLYKNRCEFGYFWCVPDREAFIFSLINRDNKPIKMNVADAENAVTYASWGGPNFGASDFCIANNSNLNSESFSNLGSVYQHPTYLHGSQQAKCFLAGSSQFQVLEIEVFQQN